MNALKSTPGGILSASGRWETFSKEPKDQSGGEEAVFKPITNIFDNIVTAIITTSELTTDNCSVEIVQNPSRAPTSAERYNATRPDGYLLLKDRSDRAGVSWADIALSCEYKRGDGTNDLDDDVRKCLWSMQHVMRGGPCRRATYGMTIKNATTRVWFCCRSSVVVSEPFNFITEPKALVELFAAFAFADKKSLGFDPTISRAPGDPTQFIITVHPHDNEEPRRFRTTQTISSFGVEPLRGRGTRVFEAIELDEHGKERGAPVVLKVVWIDHDRMREGTVLAHLYEEADEEDKKLVKRHFLATVCHGDVLVERAVVDDTLNLMCRLDTAQDSVFKLQKNASSVSERKVPSGLANLRATSRLHTHYRIVFEEKGVTVDLLPSLRDVTKALADIVIALKLLTKLGWVHRDVSIGNILWYKGGGKLGDLEYAKKMGDMMSHDLRTASGTCIGTIQFMSIEVAAHRFLFPPAQPSVPVKQAFREIQQQEQYNKLVQLPFVHIYLHDLESL
ncbi:hypothetical protein BS47DRAFT_1385014 [Hydnum rufescens UP504]|uniref:Protein kinase domain-containing protein n=1 Tax=Hydnum rufescens UP504 TaxID=1448309 RepID=A0A9P6ALV1_9AGAM|nr:hypothetical protein BS47DRAFT_1385014 [Hydnum rufescens UP504]